MKVISSNIKSYSSNYKVNSKPNNVIPSYTIKDTVTFSGYSQSKLVEIASTARKSVINGVNNIKRAKNIKALESAQLPRERLITIIESKLDPECKLILANDTYFGYLKDFNKTDKAKEHLSTSVILLSDKFLKHTMPAKEGNDIYNRIRNVYEFKEGSADQYISKCTRELITRTLQLLPADIKHKPTSEFKIPIEEMRKFDIDEKAQQTVIDMLYYLPSWTDIKRDIFYNFYASSEKKADIKNSQLIKGIVNTFGIPKMDTTPIVKYELYRDFCINNPHHVLANKS